MAQAVLSICFLSINSGNGPLDWSFRFSLILLTVLWWVLCEEYVLVLVSFTCFSLWGKWRALNWSLYVRLTSKFFKPWFYTFNGIGQLLIACHDPMSVVSSTKLVARRNFEEKNYHGEQFISSGGIWWWWKITRGNWSDRQQEFGFDQNCWRGRWWGAVSYLFMSICDLVLCYSIFSTKSC